MAERKTHLDALASSLLLACCLFWGFQQVLVKATVGEIPPVFQVALRFAMASVLVWLWCRWRGVALWAADTTLLPGLLAGGLFAAEFACIYVGLQYTSASRLTMFLYTSPFWVAGLLPLLVRSERLRMVQWAGLLCAFAAVVFALGNRSSAGVHANTPWLGDVLGLVAGMFWGLTTVVIRSSKLSTSSPEKLLFYQVAVSALVLPVVSLALGERWSLQLSSFAWMSLAVQTVLGAFASYLVWMWLLGRYPAAKMSAFVFLTPVFALVFGNVWLGEPFTLSLVLSIALVAAGILLVNKR